jgi:hypothetical protein
MLDRTAPGQRLVAKSITERTGQVFVMESRSGAIGAVAVKQAPPGRRLLRDEAVSCLNRRARAAARAQSSRFVATK